ncbi:MAG: hypothetical protein QXY40_02730 [Candidatus Methanomethylicia archaeon]
MWERLFTVTGIIFIVIGITLIITPLIAKSIPSAKLESIPWFILYIYRSDGFFFATSPILVVFAIIYLAITILRH